jgi:acyl-CoA reductase-like NAD-dependent aldehyde dehydrogenase
LFLLLFYCIKVYYYECNVVARLVASSRALIFSFCSWRLKRSRIVHKFADLVEQHTGEQAALDDGKLLLLSKIIVVPSAVQMLRYYADKIHGEYQGGGYTIKEPVGVIIPWNFPTMMFFLKVSPPLAARRMHRRGQARRSDPALRAPRQAGAGVPNGVINFVPGFVETARISSGFTALVHVWCALVAH